MLHNKPYLQLLAGHKQAPVVRVYLLADYEDDKPSSIVSVDKLAAGEGATALIKGS